MNDEQNVEVIISSTEKDQARVKVCKEEIQAVLDKYNCRLQAVVIIVAQSDAEEEVEDGG